MDPQRQRRLTLLSAKPIFGYFSREKRKTISKTCPYARRWHRTLPFHFDSVAITTHFFKIDNYEWGFLPFREMSPVTMKDPNGKLFRFDSIEPFQRFFNYYLNRKGTVIRHLRLEGDFCDSLPNFSGIRLLKFCFYGDLNDYIEYGQRFVDTFRDNQFDLIAVVIEDDPEATIVEHLKEMKVKKLILAMEKMENPEILKLNSDEIMLSEHQRDGLPSTDGHEFLDRVQPYLARKQKKYLTYAFNFLKSELFNPRRFANHLKEEWGAEHKYRRGYQGVLAIEMEDKRQLLISCYHGQFGSWYSFHATKSAVLEAEFVEEEDLVPASKLSFHNNILRGFLRWQCSVTEFMKRQPRLERFLKYKGVIRKCVFFLNNYHVHFVSCLAVFAFLLLVLSFVPLLAISFPFSFLISGLLSAAFNYLLFRPYDYDCRKMVIWDIGAE